MITTADALQVMTIVAACHHRTAPRMDDREVAMATADTWADLLNGHGFTTAELIAAVKDRAKVCPDAPEAADIIRVARATRADRTALAPEPGTNRSGEYPGDAKADRDAAEFPADWDRDQRLGAYWYALRLHAIPHSTAGWEAIATQLEESKARKASA